MNHDGTVDIVCRDCGAPILSRQPYRGYSTTQCYACYMRSLDPDWMPKETPAAEQSSEILEMEKRGFKAAGFRSITKKIVQEVKQRVTQRRRRITQD